MLPSELWHKIAVSLIQTGPVPSHIDPEPYWVLVRVSRQMAMPRMRTVLARQKVDGTATKIVLPNGYMHCDNGPAVISETVLQWYQNNLMHRDNGLPASVWADGDRQWFQNGECYRSNDLPASIDNDGELTWYLNGEFGRDGILPSNIYTDGTMMWYENGDIHRNNGLPALIHANGTQAWYKHGVLHRDSLPAIIRADGTQEGWVDGRRVR